MIFQICVKGSMVLSLTVIGEQFDGIAKPERVTRLDGGAVVFVSVDPADRILMTRLLNERLVKENSRIGDITWWTA